ncbi:MAG TPA: 4-hydroxythreonine-4-phosphate dehydrogenase PdxA [Dehalococcoidia bacterium]|nr:4-hydroxythreonine-4-phosphate dehydrogenase PdxA [Dehalococcoidia bacterium]
MYRSVSKPILAITLGDPAGVGPEVTAKAFPHEAGLDRSIPLVVGDARIVSDAAARWALGWTVDAIEVPEDAVAVGERVIPVIDIPNCDPARVKVGEVDPYTGNAAYEYVVHTAQLAMDKRVAAIVTAPLNKEAMRLAGHIYDGHTGLLGSLTNTKNYFMVLGSDLLRVIHVSTHITLGEAVCRVKRDRILDTIRAGHAHLVQMGFENPRVAVAGLNPHAGDGGQFGVEAAQEVAPAVDAARSEGIDATGPISPDAVFRMAIDGRYDIVVVLYHDQGHIPVKLVAFEEGVNVTVGLPIIRTSVDHGTGFDIAGTGVASEVNMISALDYAYKMATGDRGG